MLNLTDKINQIIDEDNLIDPYMYSKIHKIWLTGCYSRMTEFLLNQLFLKVHWLLQQVGRAQPQTVFQLIPQAYGLTVKANNAPNVDHRVNTNDTFVNYDFVYRQVTTKDRFGQIIILLYEDFDREDDNDPFSNDEIYERKLLSYFNFYFTAFPRKDCPEVLKEDIENMRKLWRFIFHKDDHEDYSDIIGKPFNPFEEAEFFDYQKKLVKVDRDLLDCTYAELKTKGIKFNEELEKIFEEIDLFYDKRENN